MAISPAAELQSLRFPTSRRHPAVCDFFKRPTVGFQRRHFARELPPALDDNVAVPGIELDQARLPARLLVGDQRGIGLVAGGYITWVTVFR